MRVTITTSSSCTPTMHREGCQHLGRIRKRYDYGAEYTIEANSLTEASLDFWSDIIHGDNGLQGSEALDRAEEYLSEFQIGPCLKLPVR